MSWIVFIAAANKLLARFMALSQTAIFECRSVERSLQRLLLRWQRRAKLPSGKLEKLLLFFCFNCSQLLSCGCSEGCRIVDLQTSAQSNNCCRNVRRDAMKAIGQLEKDGMGEDEAKALEGTVQEYIDDAVKEVDTLLKRKQDDLMKV